MLRRLLLVLFCLVPAAVQAQGTVYVPLDASAYRLLDRLAAADWIAPNAALSRPLSRAAVRRLLAAARPRSANAELGAVLVELRREFDVGERMIEGVALETTAATHHSWPYRDNNLGTVEADAFPLSGLRQGREYGQGLTAAFESQHAWAAGPLALFAQPRAQLGGDSRLLFQQLYARAVVGRFALDAGRFDRVWNPGHTAGALFSGNARSMPGARFATDGALVLPGVLHLLGPVQAELLWSDFGSDHTSNAGANVAGWRVGMQPLRAFQLGAQLVTHYGGRGAPPYSWTDVMKDLVIPFMGEQETVQFSDKLAGIDFRFAVPGVTARGELVITDVDTNPKRFSKYLREEVAHVYGIELNRLRAAGDLTAYAEFHYLGQRLYRHHQLSSGLAYQRQLLGDPLGPDAAGLYAGVIKDLAPRHTIEVQGAWERRSGDTYQTTDWGVPGDDGYEVRDDLPEETRVRLTAAWRRELIDRNLNWSVRLGAERISNFAFAADASRTNLLASVTVAWVARASARPGL